MICSVFSNKEFELTEVPLIFEKIENICSERGVSTIYLPDCTKIAEALFFRFLERGYDVKLVKFKGDGTTIFSRYEIEPDEAIPNDVGEAALLRDRFMVSSSDFLIVHSDNDTVFML